MNISDCAKCICLNFISNFYICLNYIFPQYHEDIINLHYKVIETMNESVLFRYNSRKRKRFHLLIENMVQKNNDFIQILKLQEEEDNDINNYEKVQYDSDSDITSDSNSEFHNKYLQKSNEDNETDETDETDEENEDDEDNEDDEENYSHNNDSSNSEEETIIFETDKKNV